MTPSWNGMFSNLDRPRCIGPDTKRREFNQSYGTKEPVADTEHDDWVPGLSQTDKRPTEILRTEQGPVILPFGESHTPEYFIPSVNTLNAVPFLGSRMLSLSDRYFKP